MDCRVNILLFGRGQRQSPGGMVTGLGYSSLFTCFLVLHPADEPRGIHPAALRERGDPQPRLCFIKKGSQAQPSPWSSSHSPLTALLQGMERGASRLLAITVRAEPEDPFLCTSILPPLIAWLLSSAAGCRALHFKPHPGKFGRE